MNLVEKAQLLMKYGHVKSDDITTEMMDDIAKVAGHNFTASEGVKVQLVELLKQGNIDKLGDLAQHPALFPKIIGLVTGQQQTVAVEDTGLNVVCCPFCNNYHAS